MSEDPVWQIIIGVAAALFIGIAKAGFGGGLGILVTPLAALVYPSRQAIGIVLPLLIVADIFSLYFYWRKWDARNVRWLVPGALAGIIVGIMLIGRLDDHRLGQLIGGIAVSFIGIRWFQRLLGVRLEEYHPKQWQGTLFGLIAGVTTTIAHAAGPVVALFMIPQRLPKERFVGTSVLLFALINWIKLPFFLWQGLCTVSTFRESLALMPLVPLGVWLGVWCNRRLSQTWFIRIIYATLFTTGMYLLLK
jgi:uncharacterized membrane protein YfcA